jgi:hypothetical protein
MNKWTVGQKAWFVCKQDIRVAKKCTRCDGVGKDHIVFNLCKNCNGTGLDVISGKNILPVFIYSVIITYSADGIVSFESTRTPELCKFTLDENNAPLFTTLNEAHRFTYKDGDMNTLSEACKLLKPSQIVVVEDLTV